MSVSSQRFTLKHTHNKHIGLRCQAVTPPLFLGAYSAWRVLGFLSSVGVDGLNRPIRVLPPLVLGGVDFSLAVGEIQHLLAWPAGDGDPEGTMRSGSDHGPDQHQNNRFILASQNNITLVVAVWHAHLTRRGFEYYRRRLDRKLSDFRIMCFFHSLNQMWRVWYQDSMMSVLVYLVRKAVGCHFKDGESFWPDRHPEADPGVNFRLTARGEPRRRRGRSISLFPPGCRFSVGDALEMKDDMSCGHLQLFLWRLLLLMHNKEQPGKVPYAK